MESTKKTKILVLTDWFLPGTKAGGPIQSVTNFVQAFHKEFEIALITKDRDLNETEPYKDTKMDEWTQTAGIRVFYASPNSLNRKSILHLIEQENADFLYINSMYSVHLSILPVTYFARKKKYLHKIIIAPRGMLQSHGLNVKPYKKQAFLAALKLSGLHKKVVWQGTDDKETNDILAVLGKVVAKTAPNLPKQDQPDFRPLVKESGTVRFVYMSRLHPIKNLKFFIQCLKECKGNVQLDVYGSMEDANYWIECEQLTSTFSQNIQVKYHRSLQQNEIAGVLQQSHFFVLPTLGENFGHAIFDGLITGLPLVISDTTPWKELKEKGIGWELPLNNPQKWTTTIQECIDMDKENYWKLAQNAWLYAENFRKNPDMIHQVKSLFR